MKVASMVASKRLDSELAVLFGRSVLDQAERVRLEDLAADAELVAEAARQLRELQGQPQRQREVINCMDENTALALCAWIRAKDGAVYQRLLKQHNNVQRDANHKQRNFDN